MEIYWHKNLNIDWGEAKVNNWCWGSINPIFTIIIVNNCPFSPFILKVQLKIKRKSHVKSFRNKNNELICLHIYIKLCSNVGLL